MFRRKKKSGKTSSKKKDNKPKIKIKVNKSSGTFVKGEKVEGKILITGVKKKVNNLELKALGIYLPSTSKKALDVVPSLSKLSRTNFFDHTEVILQNHSTSGSIKRDFSFELDPQEHNCLPETYYGFMYAIKYVIYANVTVDNTHEGTAKIEIQLRNYTSKIMKPLPTTMKLSYFNEKQKVMKISVDLDNTNINIKKGILGKLNFKRLEKYTVAMVYGGIVRKEEIDMNSIPISRQNAYQNIQLLCGHPKLGSYRFFFPMPKNYSCETYTKLENQSFKVQFDFIIKVVTNEGPFICERVPITLYRYQEKKEKKKKKKKKKKYELDDDE